MVVGTGRKLHNKPAWNAKIHRHFKVSLPTLLLLATPLTSSMNMNSNYLLPFSEQQNMLIKNKLTISSLWLLILTFVLLAFVFRSYDTSVIVKSDVEENACDLFMGKWVRDPTGSLYNSSTCLMLPDSKNCNKFGKDQGYLHWKWKPDACELPRFDAADFMRIVRGKTMAFVGDSLARNQMESLLCLLSQV